MSLGLIVLMVIVSFGFGYGISCVVVWLICDIECMVCWIGVDNLSECIFVMFGWDELVELV